MTSTGTAIAVAPIFEREVVNGEQLIRTICLTIQPMTRETFGPYGEIINERGGIELDFDGEQPSVAAQTVEARPMNFDFLGRHLRSEQFFAPLGGSSSVIAVAPPCEDGTANPDVTKMAAFLIDGKSAFKLHRGTWHVSAFPLNGKATFLVLDRKNTLEEDYDLRDLKTSLGVVVEIQQ